MARRGQKDRESSALSTDHIKAQRLVHKYSPTRKPHTECGNTRIHVMVTAPGRVEYSYRTTTTAMHGGQGERIRAEPGPGNEKQSPIAPMDHQGPTAPMDQQSRAARLLRGHSPRGSQSCTTPGYRTLSTDDQVGRARAGPGMLGSGPPRAPRSNGPKRH